MIQILLRTLIVFSGLAMVACSQISTDLPKTNGNDSLGGGPGSPAPAPTPAPTPAPDQAITLQQLTGSWQGGCQAFGDQSIRTRITFNGNSTVTGRSLVYQGAGCPGSAIVIVNMSGTFSIQGLSREVNKATDFNVNVSQVTGTPQSSLVAGQLNFVRFCGYSDWDYAVARNVSLNNPCLADLPLNGNQIAEIAGSTLYFGNSTKTAIDRSAGYVRQ